MDRPTNFNPQSGQLHRKNKPFESMDFSFVVSIFAKINLTCFFIL
jgi:hypothetical protein